MLENLIPQVKPRLASIVPPAGAQKRVNAGPRPVGRARRPALQALDILRRLGNRLVKRVHQRPELGRERKPARLQHAQGNAFHKAGVDKQPNHRHLHVGPAQTAHSLIHLLRPEQPRAIGCLVAVIHPGTAKRAQRLRNAPEQRPSADFSILVQVLASQDMVHYLVFVHLLVSGDHRGCMGWGLHVQAIEIHFLRCGAIVDLNGGCAFGNLVLQVLPRTRGLIRRDHEQLLTRRQTRKRLLLRAFKLLVAAAENVKRVIHVAVDP